jgi:hypothetical protein
MVRSKFESEDETINNLHARMPMGKMKCDVLANPVSSWACGDLIALRMSRF